LLPTSDSLDVLTSDERQRATRFPSSLHSNRWVAARSALRIILSRYTRCAPSEISFRWDDLGKPSLATESESPVHFSVAHSNDRGVVAVASRPVGVDLECPRTLDAVESISSQFFSSTEHRVLMRTPRARRDDMFLRLWTRKEAVLKARGDGLAGLQSIDVTGDIVLELSRGTGRRLPGTGWHLREFQQDGTLAALAIAASAKESVHVLQIVTAACPNLFVAFDPSCASRFKAG
jgi:4'-phosphopantetheinyl transferase